MDKLRSKRRRNLSTLQSSKIANVAVWAGRIAILVMLLVAPWWYGSVSYTAQLVLFLCGSIATMAWWFATAGSIFGQFANKTSAYKTRVPAVPWLTLPVALGCLFLIAQTLPITGDLADWAAPYQTELYGQFATPIEGEVALGTNQSPQGTAPAISISMDRERTSDYARLLFLALLTLVLTAQFFDTRKAALLLLTIVASNAIAISSFGLLQRASLHPDETIYGFRLVISPFGPFVNQNNAAGFLLMGLACALALTAEIYRGKNARSNANRSIVGHNPTIRERLIYNIQIFVSELDAKKLTAIIASVVIAAAITSSTSRGGVLGLAIGGCCTTVFYALRYRSFSAIVALAVLVFGIVFLVRFIGVENDIRQEMATLSEVNLVETESRVAHWKENATSIGQFAPLGSGVGTYLNVHRMNRKGLEHRVWYFAENQYFQTLLEAGTLGLVLLLTALIILSFDWYRIAFRSADQKPEAGIAVLGAFLIPSQVIAATFDFGLFIPANTLLMAALCGIISGRSQTLRKLAAKEKAPKTKPSSVVVLPVLHLSLPLLAFGIIWLATQRTYEAATIKNLTIHSALLANPSELSLEVTEKAIVDLSEIMEAAPSVDGWNKLADLLIRRYRLEVYEKLQTNLLSTQLDEAQRLELWRSTQPAYLKDLQKLDPRSMRNSGGNWTDFLRELGNRDIAPAIYCLQQSRTKSPLQANLHWLLGQLQSVTMQQFMAISHFRRAVRLAPANPDLRFSLAYAEWNSGEKAVACQDFKHYLELAPMGLDRTIAVMSSYLTLAEINSRILPDNAPLLENFARKYLKEERFVALRKNVLSRAIELLHARTDEFSLRQSLRLQIAAENWGGAVSINRKLLQISPNNLVLKIQLAENLFRNGELEKAYEMTKQFPLGNAKAQRIHRRVVNNLNK